MATSKKHIIETHGKVEDIQKFQPTLLEQVWGDDGLSRYGTIDEVEYTRRLDDMTRTDLETHARMMGVVITESSLRLKEKLLGEFRSFSSLMRKPVVHSKPFVKVSDAAMKVLAEGR